MRMKRWLLHRTGSRANLLTGVRNIFISKLMLRGRNRVKMEACESFLRHSIRPKCSILLHTYWIWRPIRSSLNVFGWVADSVAKKRSPPFLLLWLHSLRRGPVGAFGFVSTAIRI